MLSKPTSVLLYYGITLGQGQKLLIAPIPGVAREKLLQGSVLLLQHLPHGALLSVGLGLLLDFCLQNLYSTVLVLVERLYGHEPAVPVPTTLDLQTSKLLCGPG